MASIPAATQLLAFAVIAVPAHLALRQRRLPPAAGDVVMAIGIFGVATLPMLPDGAQRLRQPLAIALLVLWALLAVDFLEEWARGDDPRAMPPLARFGLGTWVAGTAVTAKLLYTSVPGWTPLAAALGVMACGLWLWFARIAGGAVLPLLGARRQPIGGSVLLATVATESLVLLAALLPTAYASTIALAPLVLGALLYVAGAAIILRSLMRAQDWGLAEGWRDNNCILHGAASITGLAAVSSSAVPAEACLALWLYAAAVFVLVETIESLRLALRVGAYGWRKGVLVYDVAQWTRSFTFGMFYAFTAAYAGRFGASPQMLAWIAWAQRLVLDYGRYVVLALLLAEIALTLRALPARARP
jgi:hypothetical protein